MIEFKICVILISIILSLEVYNDVSNELNPFSVQVKPAGGWEAYMSTSKCKNSVTFKIALSCPWREESIQYHHRSYFNGNYLNETSKLVEEYKNPFKHLSCIVFLFSQSPRKPKR